MKIVHVITAFGIGGAEKMLLNIINEQVKTHKVYLIYFKEINGLLEKLDSKVIVFRINISLRTTKKLKETYKEIQPNIIHTHLGHADLLGLWSGKHVNCKLFTTMHSTSFKNNWRDFIYFGLYKTIRSFISKKWHVISISEAVKQVVETRIGVQPSHSHLLFNAIPGLEISKKTDVKNDKTIKILFVGRLTKAKSITTLLEAIKELQNRRLNEKFVLEIIGDGELRKALENKVKNLDIENLVLFKGNKNNVDKYYQESDIFVLPSIWEGFGIVILEAFRAKLAIIASNIEGPSELIEDQENGLLFEPKNSIQLANKIQELIENKEKRKQLAEKGYKSFTNQYHISSYVKKLNELYENS